MTLFEQAKLPPMVSVCKGRYVFEPGGNHPASAPADERPARRRSPAIRERRA